MILQLLPTTPPEINGLADYARKLQQHWPDPGEEWGALALRAPSGAAAAWPGVAISPMPRSAGQLAEGLSSARPSCTLLHYVPHAFDPTGVPAWLIEGLSNWKSREGGMLFAVYHELYVWAKPWQRARLYVGRSKTCFGQLTRLVDGWVTSSARYYQEAVDEGADPGTGGIVPIGANIEPDAGIADVAKETGSVALFGLPASRVRAAGTHRRLLAEMADAGIARSVAEIGATASESAERQIASALPAQLARNRLQVLDAPEASISTALAKAEFGLCAVEAPTITRSGVYAAFCAHGVIPIVQGKAREGGPPFVGNDDRRPHDVLERLGNPAELAALRTAILDWSSTTGSWDAIAREIHARIIKLTAR